MSKAFASALILLSSALLWAQFGASLQGAVTDPSGATVPKATVTLTNNETMRKMTATTSGDGFYRFTGLAPGTYSLAVEAPNFSRHVTESIPVQAEQSQGFNVTLQPGAITQTVNVSGEQPILIQTENAQLGQEITTREVNSLPQFGRDPYELLRLAPNTTSDMARSGNGNSVSLPNETGPGGSNYSIFQTENMIPVSANGQRVSNNDYLIDGVSVNSLGWGGAAVVTPNQESVKQIVVLTNAYSAEWGRNSGAQISVISKNGTNNLHGSGFFKYDSPSLNAYNRWNGPGGAPVARDANLYRQFGGSLGGPIVRNKLFWFFSYEGLRQSSTGFADVWLETPQWRQAVISARPDSVTARILQSPGITPRVTAVLNTPCPAGFAAGTCQQVSGGLDIGSLQGQAGTYTNPNTVGSGLDGIPDIQFDQVSIPGRVSGNQYNGRVDYNVSTNNIVAASMYFTHLYNLSADATSGARPMGDINFTPLNSAATATYSHVFSPTLLNEARANFTRFAANQVASNSGTVNWGVPRLEVQGFPFGRIYFGAPWSESTPGLFAQNTYEFRDIVSKIQGNHGMKFGVELRREQDNNNLVGGARPDYVFQGPWDLANSAPIFEMVDVNPTNGGPPNASRGLRTPYYGLFVQDDWKVRPNLTLNLGLRWEYYSPPTEVHGQLSNLYFGSQILANSTVHLTDQLYRPDYNNIAPRFGLAWSPLKNNRNLAVRAGFGIFYDRIPEALFGNATRNPPLFAALGICCGTASNPFVGGQIQYNLGAGDSPFSYPVNPLLAQGVNPATGAPNAGSVEIYGAPQYMPNPMIYVYSLDLEYRLPWKIAADVGYSGSEGHHLTRLVNQNFLYPNNPAFYAVYFPMPDDNSNYNAGILTLRRPMDHGLQLLFNYRWAKSLDNSSFEGPGFVTNQTWPQNNRLNWGPSDFDARHLITTAVVWDIPSPGKGSILSHILGGWELDPIITWHTGFPWTPVIGQSVQTPGGPSLAPIRPTVYYGGADTSQSTSAYQTGSNFPKGGAAYFNITAVGPPGIGRNSFRGPRFFQTDLTFAKNTRLPWFREHSNLELRANFFNVFNQLNLAPFSFSDAGTHPENPFFGIASSGLAGRVVELLARFSF
jgi:outer membrane receptor protein involved in Fe transport